MFLAFAIPFLGLAKEPERDSNKSTVGHTVADLREDCSPSKAQIDQATNNVRARLTTGGDVWWDPNIRDGKYIVPKVPIGSSLPEVSSLYAGAVWLGGFDNAGNLKLATADYRDATNNDFYPGPLSDLDGTTDPAICKYWDRFFYVAREEIEQSAYLYQEAVSAGVEVDPANLPDGVKYWPGLGNIFFYDKYNFELPDAQQGLGNFWDENGNGQYEPHKGDFPVIDIRGCFPTDRVDALEKVPDEMYFWVYNDNGGPHTLSEGTPIQMEVQVQAFAYEGKDELNNMTFQRYKLINRAPEKINDTYYAMWVDPDLGCHEDDYIGCDIERSLMYVYNEDVLDGLGSGCACGDVNTYCENIPMIGVDYFRGPLRHDSIPDTMFGGWIDTLIELGMSSFTYYNNGSIGGWPASQTDPSTPQAYYNYLDGKWADGTPFSFGGSGYKVNPAPNEIIRYAFPTDPHKEDGWSMCTESLAFGDRRTIQASGPFELWPGDINELIIGVPWVSSVDHPCPNPYKLFAADDIAQSLFNVCFKRNLGPDAPHLDIIELDKQLVISMYNDTVPLLHNNSFEDYHEVGITIPQDEINNEYVFEGYKVYQVKNALISAGELDDQSLAKLIYQVDVRNGIEEVINWTQEPNPATEDEFIYIPEIKVEGSDKGVRHVFSVNQDAFASGNPFLVNHKKYYFMAVAYGYNNYQVFDPIEAVGQKLPYIESSRNIRQYTGIPRPINKTILNSAFGEGLAVTRLEGTGTGRNFLDFTSDYEEQILEGTFDGTITYLPGFGPVDVRIFNPIDVVDGEYILGFIDEDMSNNTLDEEVKWFIYEETNPTDTLFSEHFITRSNEQLIKDFGLAFNFDKYSEPGDDPDANGVIGGMLEFEDPNFPWLSFTPRTEVFLPGTGFSITTNYLKTGAQQLDVAFDRDQDFNSLLNGMFVPFKLCDYRTPETTQLLTTPAWQNSDFKQVRDNNALLHDLNNVNIVLTSDKDKWSRCVVVETTNDQWSKTLGFNVADDRDQFQLSTNPSVGKEALSNGHPKPDDSGTIGMSWFPGYAYDVETGKRLNIFFGEASIYDSLQNETVPAAYSTGNDMMFNPGTDFAYNSENFSILNFYFGGQHMIYVTNQEYDGCDTLSYMLNPDNFGNPVFAKINKLSALRSITWTSFSMVTSPLLSYEDGLIPNEARVKLRVTNPYEADLITGENAGHNLYKISVQGKQSEELVESQYDEMLEDVNIVPNPYYAYSLYEVNQFANVVKITNLPAECTVTIFSLDGRFIKKYDRNEERLPVEEHSRSREYKQVIPDIEWDLKNSKGIPIASGVYLIHVDSPEFGERVLKFFCVQRQFDPSTL
jgi:hypothetical protein